MSTDDLLTQLVESLDRDLELLSILRYRLVVLGALAGADQGPSLPVAVREIEHTYESLRLADLVRASVTTRLADELTLDPRPRLGELAAHVSAGWADVLLDRRRALIEAVTSLQSLTDAVHSAMGRRAALAEEALSFLQTHGAATYGRPSSHGGVLVNGAI